MRPLKLYIAVSLDGYIARKDGDVSWLDNIDHPEGVDYGYGEFIRDVDTTLMGFGTYREVIGFDVPWPYPDTTNYIFTRKPNPPADDNVTFVGEDPAGFVQKLKTKTGKAIWLIGGGQINSLLMQAGLIDEIHLSVMPVVLGEGIPLFAGFSTAPRFLHLDHQETYSSGVVKMVYKPKG